MPHAGCFYFNYISRAFPLEYCSHRSTLATADALQLSLCSSIYLSCDWSAVRMPLAFFSPTCCAVWWRSEAATVGRLASAPWLFLLLCHSWHKKRFPALVFSAFLSTTLWTHAQCPLSVTHASLIGITCDPERSLCCVLVTHRYSFKMALFPETFFLLDWMIPMNLMRCPDFCYCVKNPWENWYTRRKSYLRAYSVVGFWSIFWGRAVKQGVWSGAKLFILRQIAHSK